MERGLQLIRLAREQAAGFKCRRLLITGISPPLPQAGKCERFAAIYFKEVRLLELAFLPPLVIAVSQD
jgi:hypothetical protein